MMNPDDYEFIEYERRNVAAAPPMPDEIREKVISLFRLGEQLAAQYRAAEQRDNVGRAA